MITISSFVDLKKLDKNSIYECLTYEHYGRKREEGLLIFDVGYDEHDLGNTKYWFLLSNSYKGAKNKTKISNYKYSWIFTEPNDMERIFERFEILSILYNCLLF